MILSSCFQLKSFNRNPKIRLGLKLRDTGREEAFKDLKLVPAKCVSQEEEGGGQLYILVKLFLGFISLLFVCQRRDILHYANNDFL